MAELRPVTLRRLRVPRVRLRTTPLMSVLSRRRRVSTDGAPTVLARRPRPLMFAVAHHHAHVRNWARSVLVQRVLVSAEAGPVWVVNLRPAHRTERRPDGVHTDVRTTIVVPSALRTTMTVLTRTRRIDAPPPSRRGERGPAGPAGPPGPSPAAVPMTLATRSLEAPASRLQVVQAAAEQTAPPSAPLPTPSPPPPPGPADLEALTTQVIRRIERRAAAQRERLGDR